MMFQLGSHYLGKGQAARILKQDFQLQGHSHINTKNWVQLAKNNAGTAEVLVCGDLKSRLMLLGNLSIIIITTMIIIIIIISSFRQGIHTCVPETNHVSRVHSAAAIPHVLLMVHIALSAILNSFVLLHQQCVCCAQYNCFLQFLDSCFPGTLLKYCLKDFEMVPIAPIITGFTFVFTFHMHCICYLILFFIIIIIIIIISISFMQGIRTSEHETNHVATVPSAAAIPHIMLMVHIALSAILNSLVLLH
jgi:hypothetical protein